MSVSRFELLSDIHGHAKGEHPAFERERPVAYTPRMLLLWFYHAARRGYPRSLMLSDHTNYLTPLDPAAVATARQALECARDGDVEAAAQLAGVTVAQANVVAGALHEGMRFAIGIEADNDPRTLPEAPAIIEAMQPDWVVRSVHFLAIPHPESGQEWLWPFDNPEFAYVHEMLGADATWSLYAAKLLEDVECLRSDVVAHFYVPSKFGHWPAPAKLEKYEDRLLEICSRSGAAVELNLRVLYRGASAQAKSDYLAANRRLLRKAKAVGVRVALAHAPKDQGRGFEIALELLDECGIDSVAFPGA